MGTPTSRQPYVRASLAVAGVLAAIPWLAIAGGQRPARTDTPNVVLIVTDDVGYGDFGSYGAPDVRTPQIDSLARDGVRLTDFYANGATCSPTRAGLISGRYQQRYAIETPLPGPAARGERGLAAAGRSLPQLLKNHGYATALIGKWHLGYTPAQSPNAHGFDYFFGFKSGFIDYYMHTGGNGEPDLFENEMPVTRDGYMTDLITAGTVSFIERNAGRPFFIDVAYNAAHWPYQPPDMPSRAPGNARHVQPHDENTGTRSQYVAMLERADQGVGEILRALDRLGLAQNTLVIFTNDNGGEWLARNEPLFHRKQTLWEGGIRVPALLRWPGRIPAGRVSDQVGITMDLTASILAATGTPIPDGTGLEGIDLLPILEGRLPEVDRTLFWRNIAPHPQRAVRRGDWKLLVDGGPNGPELLFNLRQDVGERHDMANQRQDIARMLRPLIARWEADVDAEAKASAPLVSVPDRR
ncbi:MAG: sulfatase-like hydrolase/transferase [Acidobacteriota bacterium]